MNALTRYVIRREPVLPCKKARNHKSAGLICRTQMHPIGLRDSEIAGVRLLGAPPTGQTAMDARRIPTRRSGSISLQVGALLGLQRRFSRAYHLQLPAGPQSFLGGCSTVTSCGWTSISPTSHVTVVPLRAFWKDRSNQESSIRAPPRQQIHRVAVRFPEWQWRGRQRITVSVLPEILPDLTYQ